MKVLLFTSSSGWGGTEIHTLALANTLAGRGHRVNVLSLGHDVFQEAAAAQDSRVTFSRLALPGPVRQLGFWTWWRLLGRFAADVAIFPKGHINCGSLALDLAARARFGRYLTIEHLIGPPLGPRLHTSHCFGLLPGLGLGWFRQRLRYHGRSLGPQRIVCVSDAVQARLTQDYRFPTRKVLTIRNGIDTSRFRPDPRLRAVTRRRWGIAEDLVVCGMVGRLVAAKGCDVALAAFRRLTAEPGGHALRLVLVGDGPLAAPLRQAVEQGGLGDRVVFAGRTDRPWETYPALDLLLMPSRVEGLPLGLLEAMACGCCPVAMSAGGISEVLTDPALGWLVAADDEPAFVVALRTALGAGSEKRAAVGRRARAHVQTHFQARVQFDQVASVIERAGGILAEATHVDYCRHLHVESECPAAPDPGADDGVAHPQRRYLGAAGRQQSLHR